MKKAKDIRSINEIIEYYQRGLRPKYVFFWGHTPKIPGTIDQSCLSNWFPAPFLLEGIEYPTTEHYMMAEKARLFGDELIREMILFSNSPGEAKKYGRKVSPFDEDVWKKHRFEIVVKGNEAKFSQNVEMGNFLLKTGNKVIVEASPRDRIWGIGMGKNNDKVEYPTEWRGLNLLGFALMEVRERLSK
jgi:ribA/ribD-fused uncharacterized protein